MKIEETITAIAELPIPTQALLPLLKEFKRPYDKINELVKSGYLLQLRRGLYVAGPAIKAVHPERFLIANHLYGPSYVTSLSALSHWGVIPEKVSRISSSTMRKNKQFRTALGHFDYYHLAHAAYVIGVEQVQLTPRQTVLMASPAKAVCDLIRHTPGLQLRSGAQCRAFLEEDLRIDRNVLGELDETIISRCAQTGTKTSSLIMLSNTIRSYAEAMA